MGERVRPPYTAALGLLQWAWEQRSLIAGRIALAGGNPDSLSFRRFLDCAYALLIEEYQRLGMDLVSAMEKTEEFRSHKASDASAPKEPSEAEIARQNEASLLELQKMMGGL